MKSKVSYFNKGVFISDLKRFKWLSIVYLLCLLFVPLSLLVFEIPIAKKNENYIISAGFLDNFWGLEGLITLSLSIAVSVLIFGYIHSKDAADSLHSLPIKRESFFITHLLSGIFLIEVPIVINAIIFSAIRLFINANFGFGLDKIFIYSSDLILLSLIFFSIGSFCASITGLSYMQAFLALVLLALPVFLYISAVPNISIWVFGFYPDVNSPILEKISPIIKVFKRSIPILTIPEIVVYALLTLLFFILGIILYRLRKSEDAGNSIVFMPFKLIFKYGAALCGMLLIGPYFSKTYYNKPIVFLAYIIGAFILYLIAEMILQKRFNVFNRKLFRFGYFAVAVALIVGIIKIDLFGFERYIPKQDQIKSVIFKDAILSSLTNSPSDNITNNFEDKTIINNILDLHKSIIQSKNAIQISNDIKHRQTNLYLCYTLKNGKKIVRGYDIPIYRFKSNLKKIYENKTYKIKTNPIFKTDAYNVKSIRFYNGLDSETGTLLKESYTPQFLSVLKNEILNSKYEDISSLKPSWGNIEIDLKNYAKIGVQLTSSIYVPFYKSYTNLEAYLSKIGYLRYARAMPDQISYAVIGNINDVIAFRKLLYQGKYNSLANDSIKRITDKKEIENYLRIYENAYNIETYEDSKTLYYIIFYKKNNHVFDIGVLKSL